jgi:hypothetical protein
MIDDEIKNIFSEISDALRSKNLPVLAEKYNDLRRLLSEYPDKDGPEYHHYYVNTFALHDAIMKLHDSQVNITPALQPAAQPAVQPVVKSAARPAVKPAAQPTISAKSAKSIDYTSFIPKINEKVWYAIMIACGLAVIIFILISNHLFAPYIPDCKLTGPFRCTEYGTYSSALSPNANYVIVKYNQGISSSIASNISIDPASAYATGCNDIYFDNEHTLNHSDELMIVFNCDNTMDTRINTPLTISYFDGTKSRESVLTLDIAKATRNPENGALTQVNQN